MEKSKILNIKFILFISNRHLKFKKTISKFIFVSLFGGISGGLAILITVIGIMNGFQYNHISKRIEIGSYHINIKKVDNNFFSIEEANNIKNLLYKNFPEIMAIVPYIDREVLIKLDSSSFYDEQIIKLRAFDPEEVKKDKNFIFFFRLKKGFDLPLNDNYILIGKPLFEYYWLNLNSSVYITSDINLHNIKEKGVEFKIQDVFETNSYDYDRYWAFISLYNIPKLIGELKIENIGIKIKKKNFSLFDERTIANKIKKILGLAYILETSQDINRGYFIALKMEKIIMYLIFSLIFIMIAASIFGTLKLNLIEKKDEIAILKAIGSSPNDLKFIFMFEVLLLLLTASSFGILCGLFLSYNITGIFKLIESFINSILYYSFNTITQIPTFANFTFVPIKIYDESIYYQNTFPVNIYIIELISICFFITTTILLIAYIPINKIVNIKPREIIKK